MYTLNLKDTALFLQHVAVRHQQPVFLWGPPGIGKSAVVQQLTTATGATLVDIRLSQYDSVDLRGFPGVDPATGTTVWYAPSTLPFTSNPAFDGLEQPILLFLDEMNSATPAVQAVAYQLVNDRRVGEHVLRDNVVVIAAGNREGDKGVTTRMPTPLANRFTHVEVTVDADQWCHDYAIPAGLPAVGVAFIQWRKPLLMDFDPARPASAKAFATPRSWEKALRYYDDAAMPVAIRDAAMAGAVGMGPTAEFLSFVEVWHRVPKLADILADPAGHPVPDRTKAADMSFAYAIAVSLSGSMTVDNVDRLHTYLCRLEPEFTVLAWKLATKRDATLFTAPVFLDFAQRFKAIFTP